MGQSVCHPVFIRVSLRSDHMRHPYEKFIRIELFAIGLSVFIGIFAFIKSYTILMFISFYFISLSLVAEAMVAWRSEERRVGKECGSRWWRDQVKEGGEDTGESSAH